ncbi:trypsin-like serine peptidase [Myxococcus faecalis]|uniref:trypsin-like serine peptidase n=1 Tax=Myxococcus faecalis TaxID=3115646 RepID=UPI003CEB0E03
MAFSDFVTKALYTVALSVACVGLGTLLVAEIQRVWCDKRLYIGRFDFFDTGEAKATDGKTFARLIAYHHRTLQRMLEQENQQRKSEVPSGAPSGGGAPMPDSTFWNRKFDSLLSTTSALSTVELTVQGINVKELLSWLRDRVSTPNELTGTVEKHPHGVNVLVNWPRGPLRLTGQHVDGQSLDTAGHPDVEKAAFHVACGLIWAQLAGGDEALSKVPRAEFCAWAEAWKHYVDLRERSATLTGLSPESLESVKKTRAFLDRQVAGSTPHAEVYRLRADLLDLLPSDQKNQTDLAQAQTDRLKYAILMARHAPPPAEQQGVSLAARKSTQDAFEVMAQVRPALRLRGGTLAAPLPESWQQVLASSRTTIFPASHSTGSILIRRADQSETRLTAFAVAPGVLMTVGHNVPQELLAKDRPQPLTTETWEFSFDDDARLGGRQTYTIRSVIYARDDKTDGSPSVALLEIEGHDTKTHPPLALEWNRDLVGAQVGQYVYVIGYPSFGGNLPRRFLNALLGDELDTKRLMPGRVVSFTPPQPPATHVVRSLVSDVSTTTGVAGAPLVDLRGGKVVGLHFAGKWEEGQGKFAHAHAMADLLGSLPEFAIQAIKPGTIQDTPPTGVVQGSPTP